MVFELLAFPTLSMTLLHSFHHDKVAYSIFLKFLLPLIISPKSIDSDIIV